VPAHVVSALIAGVSMGSKTAQQNSESVEYVRVQNYLNAERWITRSRWFVIGFLFLYLNVLQLTDWPRNLLNGLLAFAALYNIGIERYIRKASFFSINHILVFLYLDMLVVAVGVSSTGGIQSPFLFIWYLTLFAAGIRFGFKQSLLLLMFMVLFYAYFVYRDMGFTGHESINRLILGLSSLVAAAFYGTIFSQGERFTMKIMADFRTASIRDHLTGLNNYAYFMDRLKHEQFRADRNNSHFSVILFDIDRFKQVNDAYGHEKGNVLLKAMAGIISENARGMDTVARYGGEEFVVLMPESRGAEREMAERIRRKIEETDFADIASGPIKVTISGGFCTYPHDADTAAEVLAQADNALYAAKAAGRNRTCSCSEASCA
jgi:diguanylate cyclase (GGDEF)-like protein